MRIQTNLSSLGPVLDNPSKLFFYNLNLSSISIKREFANLEDEEGKGMTPTDYFGNRNITKLETSGESCIFEAWSAHLHGFMKYQRGTCDLLNIIFKRFSEEMFLNIS